MWNARSRSFALCCVCVSDATPGLWAASSASFIKPEEVTALYKGIKNQADFDTLSGTGTTNKHSRMQGHSASGFQIFDQGTWRACRQLRRELWLVTSELAPIHRLAMHPLCVMLGRSL